MADVYAANMSLYASGGERKYLNLAERQRALAAMILLPPERALFALTLAWTGARLSEILALRASSFQIERGVVSICTLKRRRPCVREVPIPPELMAALNEHFGLADKQRYAETANRRLWPWCRVTAWRFIKQVMNRAGIIGSPVARAACATHSASARYRPACP